MHIERYDYSELKNIYGIRGRILTNENDPVFLGSMLGTLAKKESTRKHAHHEREIFCIIDGVGIIENDGEKHVVSSGDIIFLDAGDTHKLSNQNPKKLIFVSFWLFNAEGALLTSKGNKNPSSKDTLIFAPPPTPNGNLHLGHICGPYLSAEVFHRHQKQKGINSRFITGIDTFQSYVLLKSKEQGIKPQKIASHFAKNICSDFQSYNIVPDYIYDPLNNNNYEIFVNRFAKDLFDKGILQEKEKPYPYCEGCSLYLHEAHIGGYCPYCQKKCGGGPCEECGMPHKYSAMELPFCKYCGTKPILIDRKQVVFVLEPYQEQLKKKLQDIPLPSHLRAFVRELLDSPLDDIPITYETNWGIRSGFTPQENIRLCSWFEMVAAYSYFLSDDKGSFDYNNKKIVIFFGFDNSYFYLFFLLPLFMIVMGEDIDIEFVYNEFYLFEKLKFSTSRSHALWAKDMQKKFNVDTLRYYLSLTRPEYSRTEFNLNEYKTTINEDLVKGLFDWITDLNVVVVNRYDCYCPDGGELTIEQQDFIYNLEGLIRDCSKYYTTNIFSPTTVVRKLQLFTKSCHSLWKNRQYVEKKNYFNGLEHCSFIALELTALKYYAMVCYPIMPDFCKSLYKLLGQGEEIEWDDSVKMILKGTKISDLTQCIFKHVK